MPPPGTLVIIITAYVLIAALLISLNIVSRWKWWVKAAATATCGVFFVVSYFAIASLFGLPSRGNLPERFSLVAVRVVEPNRMLEDPGAIFLWVERLDENNIPSGLPVSYQLAYTPALADAANSAQEMLDDGDAVEGSLEYAATEQDEEESESADRPMTGQDAAAGVTRDIERTQFNLIFNTMPAVTLPEKGAL